MSLTKHLKHCGLLLLILLVWLLMMVFAHDFVAEQVTSGNQKRLSAIQSGTHHFQTNVMDLNDVVKSFQHHWHEIPVGLRSESDSPEVSVELSGFKIVPSIHQLIQIDADFKTTVNGVFKFEFSNQSSQLYYNSNEINLNRLNETINLKELNWTMSDLNDTKSKGTPTLWPEIGIIDAWVIRFYPEEPSLLKLKSVAVMQLIAKNAETKELVKCQQLDLIFPACQLSNSMRYLDQNGGNKIDDSAVYIDSIVPLPPWVLVLMAWVLTLFLLLRYAQAKTSLIYALVSSVYLVILLMHQNWMIAYANIFKWCLLALILLILWFQRTVFISPKQLALPIWILTVVLALMILGFSQFEGGFILSLPMYFLWACVQQLMIGPVFSTYLNLNLKTSKFTTALIVGVLFSIIHAPNHMLMLVTLLGGVVWSYAWLRYENIYANAFSHALLALIFYQVMPDIWLGSARIGVFF